MKVLLFGKGGQVGWELQRSLAPLGEVVVLGSGSREMCGDFTDLEGITRTVRSIAPDVIVNAAAYTAVDKAESEPELARTINAAAPGMLAREARRCGAWLVHFSTDYVFNGSGDAPWTETDPTGPLNVYGRTKLEGEQAILDGGCPHLILRTSWVYGTRGANFAKTILRLARERETLTVIDDQVGAPTGADLLADVTAHLIRTTLKQPDLGGLYHLAASGETTWHAYAVFILAYARRAGMELTATPEAIAPVPTSHFPLPACRPRNSRLDTTKLRAAFGLNLPHWQAGVARMLAETINACHRHP